MTRSGNRSAIGAGLALALAFAARVHAQDAGSGAGDLPDIKWSLHGERSVRAPSPRRETAPPVPAATARQRARAAPPVTAKGSAAPTKAAAAKHAPDGVRALDTPAHPRVATAHASAPKPAMPSPDLVRDSGRTTVTTHRLIPRKTGEDDGGFRHAVMAATSQNSGISPLRAAIGAISLAAALIALVAIWWQSVGARSWSGRRRTAQPRRMIDIPLAGDPGSAAAPAGDIACEPAGGSGKLASSRLAERAAAE